MSSDKAAYLAAHYLTADPKPSSSTKKRKRKHTSKSNPSGLLITDDDDWAASNSLGNNSEDDLDGNSATVVGHSAEFRRAKKSAWKTVGAPIPTDTKDARDADAIIAAAAAESAARVDDETPTMDIDLPVPSAAMMSNGTLAGLQSASDITAQLKARQALERAELAKLKAERAAQQDEEEVVLRDATGRRVDISMRRAEARRQALEAQKREEEKQKLLKGEVQLQAAKDRRERLEEAALMPLARGKDDADLNRELKEEERWNDPMAQFLAAGDAGGAGKKKKSGLGRRPVYKGAAPPNRYGIKPGYRWDGVDRGNGFESERFKAINRREMNKGLEYAWQMDE
ncbi:putative pre-mRNA splicing protein [Podospora fimiseda]|uniref:Pre-mRNA splicing protein n=1 Tax=Podospora fimiseda TaxID=252190 RepID=A0AAN7H7W4_9PEZI|nr:putative pre-mRNA splicing protein [Podospora fimiseda]